MKKIIFIFFVIVLFLIPETIFPQWVETNCPFTGVIYSLALRDSSVFLGTNGGGVYFTPNNGTNWSTVINGLTNINVNALVINGANIFAGTQGGVFLSTNNGTNWIKVSSGLTDTVVQALTISTNGSSGTNIYAGTGTGGVFRSTNSGTNWTQVNTGLTTTNILSFGVIPVGTGAYILAGTYGGGIFLSTNYGANWTQSNSGMTNMYVMTFAAITNGSSGYNVYAGTYGGGIFMSTNNGSSWIPKNGGISNLYINTIAAKDSNAYAGTNGGIFYKGIKDTSWTQSNSGLLSVIIQTIVVNSKYVFAGTYGSYGSDVWRRPISELITSINEKQNGLPTNFSLNQNYPNPFNPSTAISYQLSAVSQTTLKIFNMLGQEVATLVNGVQQAGVHSVNFNANNLTSGIYFYQLRAGNFVETKKMVLMK